jgi:hypothetical protein
MDRDAENKQIDADKTKAAETYYGTARLQQMSGGTTSSEQPAAPDSDGSYGAARIAQLQGIGSDPTPSSTGQDNDAS